MRSDENRNCGLEHARGPAGPADVGPAWAPCGVRRLRVGAASGLAGGVQYGSGARERRGARRATAASQAAQPAMGCRAGSPSRRSLRAPAARGRSARARLAPLCAPPPRSSPGHGHGAAAVRQRVLQRDGAARRARAALGGPEPRLRAGGSGGGGAGRRVVEVGSPMCGHAVRREGATHAAQCSEARSAGAAGGGEHAVQREGETKTWTTNPGSAR